MTALGRSWPERREMAVPGGNAWTRWPRIFGWCGLIVSQGCSVFGGRDVGLTMGCDARLRPAVRMCPETVTSLQVRAPVSFS